MEDLPFNTGEAESIRSVFRYIECRWTLPSHTTAREAITNLFIRLRDAVIIELSDIRSKIAFQTDNWTSPRMMFAFAGTIAHWITNDWVMKERVVSFRCLEHDQHSGREGGKVLFADLCEMGCADKVLLYFSDVSFVTRHSNPRTEQNTATNNANGSAMNNMTRKKRNFPRLTIS